MASKRNKVSNEVPLVWKRTSESRFRIRIFPFFFSRVTNSKFIWFYLGSRMSRMELNFVPDADDCADVAIVHWSISPHRDPPSHAPVANVSSNEDENVNNDSCTHKRKRRKIEEGE